MINSSQAAARGAGRGGRVPGREVAAEEVLGALPCPCGGLGHVEHRGVPVVERMPRVLLDVHLDVLASRGGLLHARYLVARDERIAPAEVELHGGVDLVEGAGV